ncbi:MAG: dienelactone hydrolase family protein [Deltaproteobacteria bacterium]|nr:dienelactone hydrolase family protein [Deltaproteobacteria bacterium]
MRTALVLLGIIVWPVMACAQLQTSMVEYADRGTVLEGYLAEKTDLHEKRPGVLVIPDWMGVREPYKRIADKMAEMGYVALTADIYGKGVRPSNNQEAAAEATKYKTDRKLLRERVLAGLAELKKNPNVDPNRIAAIGYCFGGTTVLELARSGAPVLGVVSFHGGLDSLSPEDGKNIRGKLLVLHGADDPFVQPKDIAEFQEELRKGNVDWQMVYYGDAVHSFTQQKAGTDKSKGNAYNEKADKRSWEAMRQFFREIFSEEEPK